MNRIKLSKKSTFSKDSVPETTEKIKMPKTKPPKKESK
ncbi:hypothetical protein WY13_00843 [Clostridium ljungdahlii]|uniref:Uncharacterized protein n=1 Tax=Clostridium ljungdahlii TaxID=1538 RepID=A0A170NKS9_9CLOT|nr:hypothetical protein WY13_00843 [Clostridium ljungdahlii]